MKECAESGERLVLYIVIIVERTDDEAGLAGVVLHCGRGIVASVRRYGERFDEGGVCQSDISDSFFRLADVLDDGVRSWHGKPARHSFCFAVRVVGFYLCVRGGESESTERIWKRSCRWLTAQHWYFAVRLKGEIRIDGQNIGSVVILGSPVNLVQYTAISLRNDSFPCGNEPNLQLSASQPAKNSLTDSLCYNPVSCH